ncbi:MAG: DUF4912 domain-containing protein [Candidatus Omnitrophota bacterium]
MKKKIKKRVTQKSPVKKKAAVVKLAKTEKKRAKTRLSAGPTKKRQPVLTASKGLDLSFADDVRVEETKFYTGAFEPVNRKSVLSELEHKQLQTSYQEDVIVLMARDPHWAYCFWDIKQKTLEKLSSHYANDFGVVRWVLRSYDVSYIDFNGSNANRFFDTSIDPAVKSWYLNFGSPGTSWCVDLGFILPNGRFILVLRSNIISFPLDGPSWITDEEWMIPDDDFRRLYGMSVGLGPNISSPIGKLWQERLKKDISSGSLSSMGVSSPTKKPGKIPFWLVVDAELIVYGATEPDAKVTVQGKPIQLRKDGTFTLRFAFPDGEQIISVEGISAKTGEKRVITPVVNRTTSRTP